MDKADLIALDLEDRLTYKDLIADNWCVVDLVVKAIAVINSRSVRGRAATVTQRKISLPQRAFLELGSGPTEGHRPRGKGSVNIGATHVLGPRSLEPVDQIGKLVGS